MNIITKVIIPAYNEEKSIAKVIQDLPSSVDEIVVVSNNSSDETLDVAKKAGATVLTEKRRGYGYACLKGISYIKNGKSKHFNVATLQKALYNHSKFYDLCQGRMLKINCLQQCLKSVYQDMHFSYIEQAEHSTHFGAFGFSLDIKALNNIKPVFK